MLALTQPVFITMNFGQLAKWVDTILVVAGGTILDQVFSKVCTWAHNGHLSCFLATRLANLLAPTSLAASKLVTAILPVGAASPSQLYASCWVHRPTESS